MENAEVLEVTVKKVEDILKNRTQGLHISVHPKTTGLLAVLGNFIPQN